MEDFTIAQIQTGETTVFVRSHGSGPPILLLHGFPQTHLMWRAVAPPLARDFMVVCADLRGYGRSGCPPSAPDHAPYSKRAMAQDMVSVIERLGFPRFSVAGHDRGGRVAYPGGSRWPFGPEGRSRLGGAAPEACGSRRSTSGPWPCLAPHDRGAVSGRKARKPCRILERDGLLVAGEKLLVLGPEPPNHVRGQSPMVPTDHRISFEGPRRPGSCRNTVPAGNAQQEGGQEGCAADRWHGTRNAARPLPASGIVDPGTAVEQLRYV